MAHIFDVMATVCREIDSFAKHSKNVLANVPDFMMIEANRSIDTIPGIRIDEDKPVTLEQCTRSYAGDPITTVYTAVANNISAPIIDTFAMITKGKDRKGNEIDIAETAIGVILPKIMFEDSTDITEVATLLRKVYLGVLDIDVNMHYSAEPAIVRLYKSNKIRIPTYDIEMMICAICYIYVSLGSWFTSNNGASPVPTEYALNAFTDKEIPEEPKNKIATIMSRHCASAKSLKDSVSTGKLLKIFFM